MRDRQSHLESYRQVAETKAGRRLKPHEVVDHINEDKKDGSPANLRIETRAAHTARHNKARRTSKLRKALRAVRGDGPKLY